MTWHPGTPCREVRFVVVDSETTGLDPRKDGIVTIGGLAVKDNEILLDDSFSVLVRQRYNSSAVTVHGVTRDESMAGVEEEEALAALLDWLGDGVIVGHHIGHDIATFNAGLLKHFGRQLSNLSLDTMDLTLHLERDGAFAGEEAIRNFSLDGLCARFGIPPYDRHTAIGDAYLTALVFLRLLRVAGRHGRTTLGQVAEPFPVDA
jgi:DNA polymerase-3 subunit epsilon